MDKIKADYIGLRAGVDIGYSITVIGKLAMVGLGIFLPVDL